MSDLWKDTNKQMNPVQGLQKKISNMREDGRKSQENEWESISDVDEEVSNTEEQANRDSEKINRWKFWKQKRNPQGIKFRNTVECMTNSHNQAGKKKKTLRGGGQG